MTTPLERLGHLNDQLTAALGSDDWPLLEELARAATPAIEEIVAEVRAGNANPDVVYEKLAAFQTLLAETEHGATEARQTAARELKAISRNRQAASAYENVSTRRSR